MKIRLVAVGLLVILTVSLLACATPSQGTVSWEVPIDNFMNQKNISDKIEVPAGDTLVVTLGSNPTTGFRWSESAQISDQTILKQTGHEFVPPEGTVPGAGGQEEWTFKALKAGTATVSMEYSRPWEGGEKGEWTFSLAVTVK